MLMLLPAAAAAVVETATMTMTGKYNGLVLSRGRRLGGGAKLRSFFFSYATVPPFFEALVYAQ